MREQSMHNSIPANQPERRQTCYQVCYTKSAHRICDPIIIIIVTLFGTVKPSNKGLIGDRPFVPCREVVLFLEVLF